MGGIVGGYTKWAFQTLESDVFFKKPDKWFKIWFYIVMEVNHKDNKQFKRGTNFFTYKEIMRFTRANVFSVDNCIRWLKSTTMITAKKTTRGLIITACKFNHFQEHKNYINETENDTINETLTEHKRNINDTIKKEVNKDNTISVQSEHKEIIDYFCKAWNYKHHGTYMFISGKDGYLIKSMLKTYGKEKLKELIDAFFKSNDSWIRDKGDTIGILHANVNKLVAKPSTRF